MSSEEIKIFVYSSQSDEDKSILERLTSHFNTTKSNKQNITIHSSDDIELGASVEGSVRAKIRGANIIITLGSSELFGDENKVVDFFNIEPVFQEELQENKLLYFVPVSDFMSPETMKLMKNVSTKTGGSVSELNDTGKEDYIHSLVERAITEIRELRNPSVYLENSTDLQASTNYIDEFIERSVELFKHEWFQHSDNYKLEVVADVLSERLDGFDRESIFDDNITLDDFRRINRGDDPLKYKGEVSKYQVPDEVLNEVVSRAVESSNHSIENYELALFFAQKVNHVYVKGTIVGLEQFSEDIELLKSGEVASASIEANYNRIVNECCNILPEFTELLEAYTSNEESRTQKIALVEKFARELYGKKFDGIDLTKKEEFGRKIKDNPLLAYINATFESFGDSSREYANRGSFLHDSSYESFDSKLNFIVMQSLVEKGVSEDKAIEISLDKANPIRAQIIKNFANNIVDAIEKETISEIMISNAFGTENSEKIIESTDKLKGKLQKFLPEVKFDTDKFLSSAAKLVETYKKDSTKEDLGEFLKSQKQSLFYKIKQASDQNHSSLVFGLEHDTRNKLSGYFRTDSITNQDDLILSKSLAKAFAGRLILEAEKQIYGNIRTSRYSTMFGFPSYRHKESNLCKDVDLTDLTKNRVPQQKLLDAVSISGAHGYSSISYVTH